MANRPVLRVPIRNAATSIEVNKYIPLGERRLTLISQVITPSRRVHSTRQGGQRLQNAVSGKTDCRREQG